MDGTTVGDITREKERQEREALKKAQKKEREALKKATKDAVNRVMTLVAEREEAIAKGDNPQDILVPSLDLALISIRYGTFSEEGFFKLLRNTNFGRALGISLIVGLVTWAISNIIQIFSNPS